MAPVGPSRMLAALMSRWMRFSLCRPRTTRPVAHAGPAGECVARACMSCGFHCSGKQGPAGPCTGRRSRTLRPVAHAGPGKQDIVQDVGHGHSSLITLRPVAHAGLNQGTPGSAGPHSGFRSRATHPAAHAGPARKLQSMCMHVPQFSLFLEARASRTSCRMHAMSDLSSGPCWT
eukprot:1160901-Pelagomonas_calceolata.AAC.6